MRDIVRADAWRGFRELVEELGGDPAEILAAARVDEGALVYPDRYLPLRSIVDSVEIAAKRLGRKDFGLLLGARSNLSVLGAMTLAASNAPSGLEGFRVLSRYVHIHNPALTVFVAPIPRTKHAFVGVDFKSRQYQSASQYFERGIATLHEGLRQLCGPAYRPVEVRLRNEQVSPLSVYRRMFGVTPSFGEEVMGIVVERTVLDGYQPGRDHKLREIAEAYLRSVGAPREDAFLMQVASLVRRLLTNGDCSSEQAARALGIHERTLQRRLRSESANFEQIKDDVRKEMAASLLAQPNVSLTHIAYILDYSNSSTLSRSAHRWFGMSARAYRARLLAAPEPARVAGPASRTKAGEAAILARNE